MSAENNMVELLWQTVRSVLKEAGIAAGRDIELAVAPRDRACAPLVVYR